MKTSPPAGWALHGYQMVAGYRARSTYRSFKIIMYAYAIMKLSQIILSSHVILVNGRIIDIDNLIYLFLYFRATNYAYFFILLPLRFDFITYSRKHYILIVTSTTFITSLLSTIEEHFYLPYAICQSSLAIATSAKTKAPRHNIKYRQCTVDQPTQADIKYGRLLRISEYAYISQIHSH
jgi:hypothetical protein